jgi:hypothetical protein
MATEAEERRKKRTREEKLAAGALLLARRRARKLVVAAAAPVIAQAAVDARGKGRAAVLGALLLSGRWLSAEVAQALVAARQGARQAAGRRLDAELRGLGVERSRSARPLFQRAAAARVAEDEASAAIVGDSVASQWRGIAASSVYQTGDPERSEVEARIRRSSSLLKSRIERAADTEVSKAYADEHRATAAEFSRYEDDVDSGKLVRQWVALLDACERCWPNDGEQVGLEETFPAGEPGDMHPRCACYPIIVRA